MSDDLLRHDFVGVEGGSAETIVWASTAARLLPRLINNRTSGPLFLTQRRPRSHVLPAQSDLCPTTGRARLSYRQAAKIFTDASGWTLHQIRHASLTRYAENGVSLLELKGKSRHSSTRSLERRTRTTHGPVGAPSGDEITGHRSHGTTPGWPHSSSLMKPNWPSL